MIRYIFESIFNVIKSRIFILCILFGALFCVMIYRIFDLQIINENYYLDTYVQKAKKEIYTSGTRGDIKDKNGNVLAYNKLAYNVVIEDDLENSAGKSDQLNDIIDKTVKLIVKNQSSADYDLPIILDKNDNLKFSFTSDSAKKTFMINVFGRDTYDIDPDKYQNMSPAEVFSYLKDEKYEVSDKDRTTMDILNIICFRYNLSLNAYTKYIKTTIASNVNDETMAAIYENAKELIGVSVEQDTIRLYKDSVYFAPIIGYTGKISEEQLAEYVAAKKDYISTDMVGKAGIEQSMEEYLQGTKGYQELFVDSTGQIVSELKSKEARPGNDVILSIDRDTQIAAYNLLEQKIAGILVSNIVNYDVDKHKTYADGEDIEIHVPIKDVYFSLINNNVVDISILNEKKASKNSKKIYEKYQNRLAQALEVLTDDLDNERAERLKDLEYEYQDYEYYIVDMLTNNNILLTSKIDTANDENYKKFQDGELTLHDYLIYAISNDWINTTYLDTKAQYAATEDIYNAMVKKIASLAKTDKGFAKIVYQYLIQDNTIMGGEVCMLLYDQKIFDYDADWYNKLSLMNTEDSYDFMIEQVTNLRITPAQLALDPCSGSVVVTDPDNGKVLAMVTYPSYDNNYFSGSVDSDYWAKLVDDKSTPLYSRSTQTTIAPGSTFKMITSITALEEEVIGTTDKVDAEGIFTKISPAAKCWYYPNKHGEINIEQAIGVSCNYFFYEMGFRLGTAQDENGSFVLSNSQGIERLKKYAGMFGLTSTSGIELTENNPSFISDSVVRGAIGQDTNSYNNVQLARYITTLANHGKDYELSLINQVDDKNGKTIYSKEPVLANTVSIAETTWDAVYEGLKLVTTSEEYGTVTSTFKDLDYVVAGKTGTAQENKLRYDHALFLSFEPAEDPKYACSVIIPYGDNSSYPAEVARDVYEYLNGNLSLKKILKAKASIPTSSKAGD